MRKIIFLVILLGLFSGCANNPMLYDGDVTEIRHPDGTIERQYKRRQKSDAEVVSETVVGAVNSIGHTVRTNAQVNANKVDIFNKDK